MNANEKANVYLENKSNELFAKIIKEVYSDGYEAGYGDREKLLDKTNIDYIDLELPSGTLWSADYLKINGEIVYLPYEEAIKYNLPTEEQWDELRKYCTITFTQYGAIWYINRNKTKKITISSSEFYNNQSPINDKKLCFWLCGLLDDKLANCIEGSWHYLDPWGNNVFYNVEVKKTPRYLKLPIIQVKKKIIK